MVRADSLVELRYGRSLTESVRRPGRVPVYGTNGRCGWHDEPLTTGPGVILGRKGMGNLGVEWCPSSFWVIDTAYYAAALTPQIDLRYFYYLVSYVGLNHLKDGTSNPSLSRDTFGAQLLPLPPLDTQQAIAATLSEIDDKIEQNRLTGRALEGLARATFKAWFVDFEPVKAKATGAADFPGMPRAAFAALPDRLTESPIGAVPQGWEIKKAGELASFILGGDWGKDSPTDESPEPAFCIRGADIPDLWASGVGKMPIRFLKRASLARRALRAGDIVVEISGGSPTQSTGRPVLVSDALLGEILHPLVCSNFCRIFRPRPCLSNYSYLLFRWLYDAEQFLQYENGTTGIKNLAFTKFCEVHSVVEPPTAVVAAYDMIVAPLAGLMAHGGTESRKLVGLRDYLLPRLLSGRVRVRPSRAEDVAGQLISAAETEEPS
jgi:type I restriction enzyme, S subunit